LTFPSRFEIVHRASGSAAMTQEEQMTSNEADRPAPGEEPEAPDSPTFHGADVPDEPDRPAPGVDEPEEEDENTTFHSGDVADDS
jgi:hypothetical protein